MFCEAYDGFEGMYLFVVHGWRYTECLDLFWPEYKKYIPHNQMA